MTLAPESVYTSDRTETLPDARQFISHYPEATYLESDALARHLRLPVAEVEAARDWLIQDEIEVRA